jgi:hypothetical protein
VSPKLKSLLARVTLAGGIALFGVFLARHAPHDQTIAIRWGGREVLHVDAVITRRGDDEPTAGFSQDFAGASARMVRHTFSAPSGTYIVVITFRERPPTNGQGGVGAPPTDQGAAPPTNEEGGGAPTAALPGDHNPNPIETSFERQVSLAGGEVIVSPD